MIDEIEMLDHGGWTPSVATRRLMMWHMQHDERLKMIKGFSDIRCRILASVVSATLMDKRHRFLSDNRRKRSRIFCSDLLLVYDFIVLQGPRNRLGLYLCYGE
ncbi:hypothetical protein MRB53_014987 [Persea americana]|uniref:Uncharacterized protein n=1 Tax=Persea americana TaxID=3435 RepID=A0ACC2KCQ7_PERAE|nr:hypothetical protein MRB53_014987 [Persea americana]